MKKLIILFVVGFVIVTVIWTGLMASTLIPGGGEYPTLTVCVPTSRPATDTFATRAAVSSAFSDAVAPPRVTITLGADRT